MKNNTPWRGQDGFTLIEVLVTLILLAILAAAVFPVVTQQAEQGDPVRAAQDLSTMRSGIEQFQLDVRPSFPGDLEDLVFSLSTVDDATVAAGTYSTNQANKWNGPYVDLSMLEGGAVTGTATETGFGGTIDKDLTCYNATTNTDATTTCAGAFVAVKIGGLTEAQFESINDLIDGENETDGDAAGESQLVGKFRFLTPTAFYLAAKFR